MQILDCFRRIFDRDTKVKLIILLFAIIFGALLETLALSIVAPFISILLDNSIIETNIYIKFVYDMLGFTSANAFLAFLMFILSVLYIFRGYYIFVLTKIQYRFIARRQANLSEKLLQKILDYPYLYHSEKNISEFIRIILSDTANLFTLIISTLLMLSDLFMTIFIIFFLMTVSPQMTFSVILMASVCALIYFALFRKPIHVTGKKFREISIEIGKIVIHTLHGVKEIKALRREDFFRRAFRACNNDSIKYYTKFRMYDTIPKFVIESVCFGGAFIFVGVALLTGTNVAGLIPQLGVFVLAAFRLLPAVARMLNQINQIIYNRASAIAVYKALFKEDQALVRFDTSQPEAPVIPAGVGDIVVNNVTFRYPNAPEPVLESISLIIPHNQSVALVGPSGAGKTTLADIILGLYSPESGGVFFDGNSIHHGFTEWSKYIGYVPQQIFLIDDTIRNNVAFGISFEKIDDVKVWESLEQAQLADFVRSLPDGLDTPVGDRGVRLSGGQRQRTGIARALYQDPPILIFDEATSSLDGDTEKAVMDAIINFQGNKTMLIVAHRLSTIEHCDIVYQIEGRSVVRKK